MIFIEENNFIDSKINIANNLLIIYYYYIKFDFACERAHK